MYMYILYVVFALTEVFIVIRSLVHGLRRIYRSLHLLTYTVLIVAAEKMKKGLLIEEEIIFAANQAMMMMIM